MLQSVAQLRSHCRSSLRRPRVPRSTWGNPRQQVAIFSLDQDGLLRSRGLALEFLDGGGTSRSGVPPPPPVYVRALEGTRGRASLVNPQSEDRLFYHSARLAL